MTPRDDAATLVDWLIEVLCEEAPGLTVERAERAVVRLRFEDELLAERFSRALLAENMAVDHDGSAALLRIVPWYGPEDVESLALAVAKVVHYLAMQHAE